MNRYFHKSLELDSPFLIPTQYLLFIQYSSLRTDDCFNIFSLTKNYHGAYLSIVDAEHYCESLKVSHDMSVGIYMLVKNSFELVRHGFYHVDDKEWWWIDG